MEGYRYQQFAYLVVPIATGIECFLTAKTERKKTGKACALAVFLESFGYVFIVLIPILFVFTIFSIERHYLSSLSHVLHRVDRYGVMFFFLGSWWQVFFLTSLRARRAAERRQGLFVLLWLPYLLFGAFISALILWVAPWNLMWVSVCWFVLTFGVFAAFGVSPGKLSKIFFFFSLLVLGCENILFIILDAIV
jgi:hypothetical protein